MSSYWIQRTFCNKNLCQIKMINKCSLFSSKEQMILSWRKSISCYKCYWKYLFLKQLKSFTNCWFEKLLLFWVWTQIIECYLFVTTREIAYTWLPLELLKSVYLMSWKHTTKNLFFLLLFPLTICCIDFLNKIESSFGS
jgi:hypothetical protein